MHPIEIRRRAQELHDQGVPFTAIWQGLGVPKSTVINWLYGERGRSSRQTANRSTTCWACDSSTPSSPNPIKYSYLLGQYLGDGTLVMTQRVPTLEVYGTTCYPGILDEVEEAMRACEVRTVHRLIRTGCTAVRSRWKHWPCLLPQHGPGLKHTRPIVLAEWQRQVVEQHPKALLRGLIHSDGCRSLNRVTVRGRQYSYPRYLFSNKSADILRICGEALDLVGAQWRYSRRDVISVAKRASVALLDEFIGPKR